MKIDRRMLIRGAAAACLAGAAAPAWAEVPFAGGLAGADPGLDPQLRARALDALARHNGRFWSRDRIGIVDYGKPSSVPRLHIVNIIDGTTRSMLVAHGKGSDPDHTGLVQRFSNVEGSLCSSEGAYLTGRRYEGVHGAARRLIGLDPTNDQADPRAIVIHSAWYVGPDIVARQGVLGRSDGCFVVSPAEIGTLLADLPEGRLLYCGAAGR